MNRLIKKVFIIAILIKPWIAIAQDDPHHNFDEDSFPGIKQKYPEADFVLWTSEEEIQFVYDKFASHDGEAELQAKNKVLQGYVSVRGGRRLYEQIITDNESSLSPSYTAAYRKGVGGFTEPTYTFKDPYEIDGIFYSDAQVNTIVMDIPSPGEARFLKYKKYYNDLRYLSKVFFHSNYPTLHKEISFEIPNWLEVDLIEINFEGFDIKRKEIQEKKSKIITYTLDTLDAIPDENNRPGISHFLPHIIIVCKTLDQSTIKSTRLINSLDSLYSWYHELVVSVEEAPDTLQEIVSELTKDKTTDQEKVEAIYYWVQDNVNYLAFEDGIAGFKPDACQKVFRNRFGDCKGMANLTKQMLTIAGYDARLTWLGTRDLAYDYSIPSIAVDNHMICMVNLNGKRHFIDPTEKFIAFGDHAHRIQGRQVLVEDGENYFFDTIPEYGADRNKVHIKKKLSISGETLTGTINREYNGEGKTDIMRSYSSIKDIRKEEALNDYLSRNDKNIVVSEVVARNLTDRSKPIEITYNFSIKNQVMDVDQELIIDLEDEKPFSYMEFDSTRKTDYVFSYKPNRNMEVELTIPSGYRVKYLPPSVEIKNEQYQFIAQYEQKQGKVIYHNRLTVFDDTVKKDLMEQWNADMKTLLATYHDHLILSKTN